MKNIFVMVVLGLCMACHRIPTCEIQGTVPGAKDGMTVKLVNIEQNQAVVLDSAVIQQETFSLQVKQPLKYPTYCQLVVDMTPDEGNQRNKTLKAYRFFADNAPMKFHCQIDSMPSYYWEPVNKEHHVTLTGGPTQELYNRYREQVKELSKQIENLRNDYLKVYHLPAIKGEFHTAEGMEIVREQNRINRLLNTRMLSFIKENKASVVSLFLAANYLRRNKAALTIDEINDLVNGFDPSLQQSGLMKDLIKEAGLARCVAKGTRFHDIELTNLQGEKVKLSEYVKPGVYNMLEFWASWCGPCRGEIPHLRHLYLSGGKEYFHMISISIDEKDADWKKAVQEEKMEWTQLCEQQGFKGPLSKLYGVHGVPYCLILDPEGKIVCGGVRGAELDVVVTDLLGDKLTGL